MDIHHSPLSQIAVSRSRLSVLLVVPERPVACRKRSFVMNHATEKSTADWAIHGALAELALLAVDECDLRDGAEDVRLGAVRSL